jgi:hypothetical protein
MSPKGRHEGESAPQRIARRVSPVNGLAMQGDFGRTRQ